eukprot:m.23159 g.23159  ORF g.23159 m.23159 type:complete len:124 (+) comp8947_c0_seq1:121-492(+)
MPFLFVCFHCINAFIQNPFHPFLFATSNRLFQSLQLYFDWHGFPSRHEHDALSSPNAASPSLPTLIAEFVVVAVYVFFGTSASAASSSTSHQYSFPISNPVIVVVSASCNRGPFSPGPITCTL